MKKNFLKNIVIIILVVIALVVFWIYTIDPSYTIIRQTEINVPQRFAYQYLNDLKNRKNWSLWESSYKNQIFVFSPQTKGVGATYSWKNLEGETNGEITITKNKIDEEVTLQYKKYDGIDQVVELEWEIDPVGTKSLCVIEVHAKTTFFGRFRKSGVIRNISEDIEKSMEILADSMQTAYLEEMPKVTEGFYGFRNVLSITKTIAQKRVGSRDFVWPAIEQIQDYINLMGYAQAGPPFTIFHSTYGNNTTVEVGVPVTGDIVGKGDIIPTLMMGEIFFVEVNGSYNQLDDARYFLEDHIIKNKLKVCCDPFEEYIVMPSDSITTAGLVTRICIPK